MFDIAEFLLRILESVFSLGSDKKNGQAYVAVFLAFIAVVLIGFIVWKLFRA